MIRHAGDRMIRADTVLTSEQRSLLNQAIKRRRAKLRRLGFGAIEQSLWLMEELEHLEELRRFNAELVMN